VAAAVILLAGCGTRLPDSAFRTPQAPSQTPSRPAATITIGTIASLSNPFDAQAFAGPSYGLRAFVDDINRRGGINGRRLVLKSCDDSGDGSHNVTCVHRLVEQDHVFALVANAILSYGGANLVNQLGVPDIGSQPIDVAYTQYPHLWDIAGEDYPREGKVGWNGKLHNGTEVYRYFKVRFPSVPLRAGVVYYNQASSQRYGDAIARGLEQEGYSVTTAQVNFALPDFNSVAIKLRHAGVRYVYDAIDRAGNERLCKAIDDNQLDLTAKITTTQSWDATIGTSYADSPRCRNEIYATGGSLNYDDRSSPQVAQFRTAMSRLGWDTTQQMSQWALEGWAGARWFADAAASCGSQLTRACVERFMARATPYDAGGLLIPRDFTVGTGSLAPHEACINVVRWQDSANNGAGGWVNQVPDMTRNCYNVPSIAYEP